MTNKLANFTDDDLRTELARRDLNRIRELEETIQACERELRMIRKRAMAPTQPRQRRPNGDGLLPYIAGCMDEGAIITPEQSVEMVIRNGYEFQTQKLKSRSTAASKALSDGIKAGMFVRESRGVYRLISKEPTDER